LVPFLPNTCHVLENDLDGLFVMSLVDSDSAIRLGRAGYPQVAADCAAARKTGKEDLISTPLGLTEKAFISTFQEILSIACQRGLFKWT
jgi:hypothetical protein